MSLSGGSGYSARQSFASKFLAWSCAFIAVAGSTAPARSATLIKYVQPQARQRQVALRTKIDDIHKLKDYDVVVVVDRSRSMSLTDCPGKVNELEETSGNISRWQWCQEQLSSLARRTQGVLPHGVRLVLFSDYADVYDNLDMVGVEKIFGETNPSGATRASLPLYKQMVEHFENRSRFGAAAKPLLIAVISDGCPNDARLLSLRIASATRQMQRPDEIAITFIQIGSDPRANTILDQLDNRLVEQNRAKYDIVAVKKFAEVDKTGLSQTLIDAVAAREPAQAANPEPLTISANTVGH